MSAANRAPNVDTIASDLAKAHPDWNREKTYAEAHSKFVVAMRAYTNDVVTRVTADPTVLNAIRLQRAQQEARRMVRPKPNLTALISRERDRLMREEGCILEDAIVRASETVRETMRLWERDHLQETRTILQRDAAKPIQLAAPRAPVAKPAPPVRKFVPGGMTPSQARDEAARPGGLPVLRSAPPDERHMRIQDRIKLLQATRAECKDYTAAYLAAKRELDAEDDANAVADEGTATALLASRVEERRKTLRHLSGFADFSHCSDDATALATARAQIEAEDRATKGGAK
jgi:hypothetical protein